MRRERVSDDIYVFTSSLYAQVTASAVVGVAGLKKIVYDAVIRFSGRQIATFDTVEQAKGWLAER